jgi:transcriptional regulator with XRE-family HTH domain
MDNRHSIGSKIQKYRKLKDMTQDELSKQSGIYLSTIKKYESGERNPKIAEALGISVTVFLDYDINTVSDVLSLVMKLNEQSSLKISADKDKDGNYIPSSIHMTFEDSQINEAICSYLNCKQQMDLISYEDNDKAVIEQQKEFYDDKINRLLLFNERIKKIR